MNVLKKMYRQMQNHIFSDAQRENIHQIKSNQLRWFSNLGIMKIKYPNNQRFSNLGMIKTIKNIPIIREQNLSQAGIFSARKRPPPESSVDFQSFLQISTSAQCLHLIDRKMATWRPNLRIRAFVCFDRSCAKQHLILASSVEVDHLIISNITVITGLE